MRRARWPTVPDATGLFEGDLDGVVVEGVLSAEQCAEAVLTLQQSGLERHRSCYYPGGSYGQVLLATGASEADSEGDSGAYRAAARALEAVLPRPVLSGVTACLKALNPGHPLGVPRGRDGLYAGFTVRVLEPGGAIALHSERPDWPAMQELASRADLSVQLSFYVVLQAPQAGGELLVYEGAMSDDAEAPHAAVVLGVGDLILFDGTRHNHRVSPVEGSLERWTLGGFLARAGERRVFFS